MAQTDMKGLCNYMIYKSSNTERAAFLVLIFTTGCTLLRLECRGKKGQPNCRDIRREGDSDNTGTLFLLQSHQRYA